MDVELPASILSAWGNGYMFDLLIMHYAPISVCMEMLHCLTAVAIIQHHFSCQCPLAWKTTITT